MVCDSKTPNICLISAGLKPHQEYIVQRGTIMRIMSQVQPDDSSVTSDTKETMDCIMQFSVTLTLAAMQEGRRDRHLTITDANLIVGSSSLGLVDYVQLMTEYLRLYHDDPKGEFYYTNDIC